MRDAWWDLVHGGACCGCGRPGRALCGTCDGRLGATPVQVAPDPCPPGLVATWAAGAYADPLRTVILQHKERHGYGLTRPLGHLLAAVVESAVGDPVVPVVLVPVPSSRRATRARGHDPLLRLTRVAAGQLRRRREASVLGLLRQRRAVADQAGLDATARARNLHGSMIRAPDRSSSGVLAAAGLIRVVVCDDVLTTGATAREAQRALEDAGTPVWACAVLAATRRIGAGGDGHGLSEFGGAD